MRILSFLDRRSRLTIWVMGSALVVLIGAVDYLTGYEISFSVFYLLPVALMTWYDGKRGGILFSALSMLAWLGAEFLSGALYSLPAIPYWNALVRFSFFLIVTFTLASLREAKNRQEELGHFIVHDLRSPISNIQTALSMLLDEDPDQTERDLIAIGLASSSRMLTLINSLLDLAKLESGKLIPNQQVILLGQMVEPATQQVLALANRSDVQISARIDTDMQVYADADLTVRILVNLLSNAIKHSPARSTVTVHVEPAAREMIAVHVSDQGKGIPAQWQNKVFDRFAQVEARRAGFATGSGLGLTFCRLAVESQGGRIGLTSEPGQGTTVTFTLPQRPS